jgi:GNAT superfamily N-acetyltransferase
MIRRAAPADLDAVVALCDAKRAQYAAWQPVFHRPATNAAANQRPFLENRLGEPDSLLLVADEGGVAGFLWAKVVGAPPVYDPGGPVVMVDDFVVARPDRWATTGRALLEEAMGWGKDRGAVLVNVVCGPRDERKRELLTTLGLSVASEWFVAQLVS